MYILLWWLYVCVGQSPAITTIFAHFYCDYLSNEFKSVHSGGRRLQGMEGCWSTQYASIEGLALQSTSTEKKAATIPRMRLI